MGHCFFSSLNGADSPLGGAPGKSALARLWSRMDDNLMKPLLTHSNPTLMETMPGCCLPLARLLTSTEQLAKHPAMQNILTDDLQGWFLCTNV